jgi:hypothetical protein
MTNIKPEARLMPDILGGLPRLECHFGWNDQASRYVKDHQFDSLLIRGGKGQSFMIPDLGTSARKVKSLSLSALGSVTGLEQFQNSLEKLDIKAIPDNGLDFNGFPHLSELSAECTQKIESQIHGLKSLSGLSLRYYSQPDVTQINCAENLKKISISQSSVVSLNGVSETLEHVELSYLSRFTDVETLNKLPNIRLINCAQLKKWQGVVQVSQFKKARFIRFVETPVVVDFQGVDQLQKLEKLWLNGAHVHLKWQEILALPNLHMVGLSDADITDEEISLMAGHSGKRITELIRAGTRKNPHIQIKLTPS